MPFQHTFMDKVTVMLRHYREGANLSQAEVAELLKIGVRSYQRYEAGESIPSVDLIFSLSQALKFDLKDFFAPHEAVANFPGLKFYKGEEESNFISDPLVIKSGLIELFNSEAFLKIVNKGDIKAIRENTLFKNSPYPLILCNPKTSVLNKTAKEMLGLHSDTVPSSSVHKDIRSLGMVWSTLMDTEVTYFKSPFIYSGNPKTSMTRKCIFGQHSRNYVVLSVLEAVPYN